MASEFASTPTAGNSPSVIAIGSAEYGAYELFRNIAAVELRSLDPHRVAGSPPDREWILDTYAQCLRPVRNPEARSSR